MIKAFGLLIINITMALIGISAAMSVKAKESICSQLAQMAEIIGIELNYSLNSYERIVNALKENDSLTKLSFLNELDAENVRIRTRLSKADNERIEQLFETLGNVDSDSMIELLSSFKSYFNQRSEAYALQYQKNGKLYSAFGILGGAAFSLIFI